MADYDLMTGVKKAYDAYSPTNKPTPSAVTGLDEALNTKLDKASVVASMANGGVIERGSNANGGYVKFADGTLICTGQSGVADICNIPTVSGSFFSSAERAMVLPHVFVGVGEVLPTCKSTSSGVGYAWGAISQTTSVGFTGRMFTPSNASPTYYLSYVATGNWK